MSKHIPNVLEDLYDHQCDEYDRVDLITTMTQVALMT